LISLVREGGGKKPVKTQGNSYSFDIAESEYDNQIALSSTKVKEKGLNSKTMFIIKKVQ
jgi:hypothetical protein